MKIFKEKIDKLKASMQARELDRRKLEASNCFGTTVGTCGVRTIIPKHFINKD